jgi:hypothetical protein
MEDIWFLILKLFIDFDGPFLCSQIGGKSTKTKSDYIINIYINVFLKIGQGLY